MWQKNWKIISLSMMALVASTAALAEYRRITVLDDRLGCAAFWLDQARSLHRTQMAEPKTGSSPYRVGKNSIKKGIPTREIRVF